MGILISRFRRKPTVREQLEKLEVEIENIEDFKFDTQYRQKRYLGTFLVASVVVYIILFLLWLIYFPESLLWKLLSSLVILVLLPVIIYFIRRFMLWYYSSQISRNDDKITLLHREKKKLLKEVMEKETYNVARELLQKYDPTEIKKKAGIGLYSSLTNAPDILSRLPEMELRKRTSLAGKPTTTASPQHTKGPRLSDPGVRPSAPPSPIIKPGYNAPPGTKVPPPSSPSPQRALVPHVPIRPAGIPMPCPILPRDRSVLDRMVEYVVGDGPGNRFALICRQCQSHNGMALKEEFEYIAFRCCYCYFYNPARRQRLVAPRLSLVPPDTTSTKDISEDAASSSSLEESESDGAGERLEGSLAAESTNNDDQLNSLLDDNETDQMDVIESAKTTSDASQSMETELHSQEVSDETFQGHEEDEIRFADDEGETTAMTEEPLATEVTEDSSASASPLSLAPS